MAAIRQRPSIILLVLLLATIQASGKPCDKYQGDRNRITLNCAAGQTFDDSSSYPEVEVFILTGSRVDWRGFFKSLPNLVEARITNSYMFEIQALTFRSLPKLEKLDLSNNNIQRIYPQAWNNMDNLRVLNLSGNKIMGLSSYQFKNLTSLEVLDLSNNQLREMTDKELDGLSSLKQLRLDGNELTGLIGKSISKMENLKLLNVSRNPVIGLDESVDFFSKLPKLQELDLGKSRIFSVSGSHFQSLTNLKRVDLSSSHLKVLGDNSFRSMDLKHLDLSGNHLTTISKTAFDDLKCGTLKLSETVLNFTELGSALRRLRSLDELDLSSSNIRDLDLQSDLFEALKDSGLKRLNLSNNHLTQLPKLPYFVMIQELDFSKNQITTISGSPDNFQFNPEFFNRLDTGLTHLYLQQNQLACQHWCDLKLLKRFEQVNRKCNEDDYYCLRCAHPAERIGQKISDLPVGNSSSSSDIECEVLLNAVRGYYPPTGNFVYFLILTILTVAFLVFVILLFVFRKKVFRSVYHTGEYRANGVRSRFNRVSSSFNRLLRKENRPANGTANDPAARKLVDGEEQVLSNSGLPDKQDKEQEICLCRLDAPQQQPAKYAGVDSRGATDVTRLQLSKNGAAQFEKLSPESLRNASEKPNPSVQQSDPFFV